MRKLLRISAVIILSWFIVSTYFYFHNRVTVKYATVPGWNLKGGFQIKKVKLLDKEKKRYSFDFYQRIYSNTPNFLLPYVLRIVAFYTPQYKKPEDGKWIMQIYGVYIGDLGREIPQFVIRSEPQNNYTTSTVGKEKADISDLVVFNIESKNVIPNAKYYSLEYNFDGKVIKSIVYSADFESYTYHFLRQKPTERFENIIPVNFISDTLLSYKKGEFKNACFDGNTEDLFKNYTSWLKDKNHLSVQNLSLSYVRDYKRFKDVIKVDLIYSFDPVKFVPEGKQTFYVIETNEGWKIADFTSYVKL